MNKRGQLGQILTTVPVLILVFVVMLIFVIIVSGVSLIKGYNGGSSVVSGSDSLLLQKINWNGEKVFVFDVIKDFVIVDPKTSFNNKENKDSLEKELMGFVDENFNCLALFKTKEQSGLDDLIGKNFYDSNLFIIEFVNGKPERYENFGDAERVHRVLKDKFGWPENFQEIKYTNGNDEFFISSYYGSCVEEAKNE